ncbi:MULTISPECIES: DUF4349 domain-containing protein [unclassified Mucilaginibacter]|uniref:DUF4349 domain-containing protein n=1 Tax=unclassified Mucilaginibacter TaxID=2617802 RepID=UPI002AC94044|nr:MULTISPECIES: DUF4349 domain-containing protein [unclassified Mucilaginibacter]MEB0278721.1 DUF4349 domain-containing protein [Mucilaginibacter sp. 10B2]MEB0302672.1 DUF4349 domain-containing protein [Mucilaginibacter sp. 5C4]WPX23327.1 DUF4349 domain-containing protein [Mucilaginibacter sp. 5C4]
MKTRIFIAIAAIALFAACKGRNGSYEIANNGNSSNADTASSSADTVATAKLVKTADMSFKVKNVQQTGDSISRITAKLSGMVTHYQMGSSIERSEDIRLSTDSVMRVSAFNTTADMTVKIPSEKLEDFMNYVSHMGIYVTSRKMDIENKSLDYLSAKLKLKNRREMVAQQKTGKIKIKDPAAVLWLKDDMIDGQINNQRIDEAVNYSVVSLNFYRSNTIYKERIANDDPSAYKMPFGNRLLMALSNGWYLFAELILGLANLWVLILVGAGLWIAFKTYKRKFSALKV